MPDTITISGDGVDITGAVLPNATFRIDRVSGQTVASGGAFSVGATFVAVTDSNGAIGRMDNGSFVATFDLVTGHSYRVTPQAALGDLRPFFLSIPESASSGTINDFLVPAPIPPVAVALQASQEAQQASQDAQDAADQAVAIVGSGNGQFPDGSQSDPSITFASDTNTGLFRPGSNTLSATTGGTERLRIDSAGNVGIGTSSPTARLDVVGEVQASGTIERVGGGPVNFRAFRNNSDFNSYYEARTNAGSVFFGTNNGEGFMVSPDLSAAGHFVSFSPDLLTFRTQATERLRIDSAGNVGIGTSSPVGLLQVQGEILSNTANSAGAIGLRTSFDNTSHTLFGDNLNINLSQFFSFVNPIRVRSPHYIAFQTGGTNERLRITSAGNVGIGTSSPGSKLSIVGLPTSPSGLSSGDVWNDGGTLKIV